MLGKFFSRKDQTPPTRPGPPAAPQSATRGEPRPSPAGRSMGRPPVDADRDFVYHER